MFSKIGTMELLVILVIALFVIGPEKLPGVAKSIGKMFGAARYYLKDITGDVQTEIKAVEEGIRKAESDLKEARDAIQNPLKETGKNEPAPVEEARPAGALASTSEEAEKSAQAFPGETDAQKETESKASA